MQTWEYMVWVLGYAGTHKNMEGGWGGGVVKYRNGQLVPSWKNGPRLPEALNQAGGQGWELVSTNYFTQGNAGSIELSDPMFVFKRSKP
jgi:hypothetical protein